MQFGIKENQTDLKKNEEKNKKMKKEMKKIIFSYINVKNAVSRFVLAVDKMVHCLLPFADVEYVFLFIKSILYFVQSIHR